MGGNINHYALRQNYNDFCKIIYLGKNCYSVITSEDFISAYFKCEFQIPLAKIYQNTTFQLSRSCESKDVPI